MTKIRWNLLALVPLVAFAVGCSSPTAPDLPTDDDGDDDPSTSWVAPAPVILA